MEDKKTIQIIILIFLFGIIILLILNNKSKELILEDLKETKKQNLLLVSVINNMKIQHNKKETLWEKIQLRFGHKD